jgi:RNase P subunit RPR2
MNCPKCRKRLSVENSLSIRKYSRMVYFCVSCKDIYKFHTETIKFIPRNISVTTRLILKRRGSTDNKESNDSQRESNTNNW